MMYKRFIQVSVLVLTLAIITACSPQPETVAEIIPTNTSIPEPTETPIPEIPLMQPGETPPQAERTLEDSDASLKAQEKRVVSGDNILTNLYERPFTSEEMLYLPDLNILSVSISSGETFFYFTIEMEGLDPDSGGLGGTYGIEFDRTLTGRGDLLVLASDPQSEWSTENVVIYVDENNLVGGLQPILAETDYKDVGYSKTVEMEKGKVAWARSSAENEAAIEIAVSRALLGDPEEFLWGAWALGETYDPAMFDYNDHFSLSEAGSPIRTDIDYPLKALAALDNTCRFSYGFDQLAHQIPGMCIASPEHRVTCVCVQSFFGICIQEECK